MKRIIALLLSVVLALSLVACGDNASSNQGNSDSGADTIRIGVMNCFTGGMAA